MIAQELYQYPSLTHIYTYILTTCPFDSVWDCLESFEQRMKDADAKRMIKQAQLQHEKAMKQFKLDHAKAMEANPGGRGPRQPKKPVISPVSTTPPFARYDDWSKAQLAVEDIERKEAIVDATKRLQSQSRQLSVPKEGVGRLEVGAQEEANTSEKGAQDMEEEDDEEEDDDDEEDDVDDGEEEEDGEDDDVDAEEEEEDDRGENEVIDEEGEVYMDDEVKEEDTIVHVEAKEKSPEDDEFERMLAKTMKVFKLTSLPLKLQF